MILADKIIRLRKKNGWSQEELAYKMNVSRQAVSRKRGTVEFTGLNLYQSSYTFKIEITYKESADSIFANTYYSDEILAEKIEQPVDQPDQGKKGCKKSSADLMVATLSVASLAVFVLRKKK